MPRKKKVTEKSMTLGNYGGRQMIPADNVDTNGIAWSTVGENIRHGSKETLNKEEVLKAISALFGINVSYEEVNCIFTPGTNIICDNPIFEGHETSITTSKIILSFVIIDSNITSGSNVIGIRLLSAYKSSIFLQVTNPNALKGSAKLGVLVA